MPFTDALPAHRRSALAALRAQTPPDADSSVRRNVSALASAFAVDGHAAAAAHVAYHLTRLRSSPSLRRFARRPTPVAAIAIAAKEHGQRRSRTASQRQVAAAAACPRYRHVVGRLASRCLLIRGGRWVLLLIAAPPRLDAMTRRLPFAITRASAATRYAPPPRCAAGQETAGAAYISRLKLTPRISAGARAFRCQRTVTLSSLIAALAFTRSITHITERG